MQNAAIASREREGARGNRDRNPDLSDGKKEAGAAGKTNSTSVKALESVLADRSEDYRLRWRAARALGETAGQSSIGVLSEALDDDNLAVRLEAIAAIGKIGGPAASKILEDSLEDVSYRVRSRAARALIQLSGVPSPSPANIKLFIKLLSAGDERVMEAIKEIGMPAYGPLAAAREDDSFLVRRDVSIALALLIRGLIEDRLERETVHHCLARSRRSPESLSRLYDIRVIKEQGLVKRVETTNFEKVSGRLRGKGIFRLNGHEGLPLFREPEGSEAESAHLESFLSERAMDQLEIRGRTLIFRQKGENLAIKLSIQPGDEGLLLKESLLQSYLREHRRDLGLSSSFPEPLRADRNSSYLFRLEGVPSSILDRLTLAGEPTAICYRAQGDYFIYLNDPSLSAPQLGQAFRRCAGDLACLARAGLIHTSLIPLYHNREQVSTRSDRGIYSWWSRLAGRLDRWRESCSYPNLRLSGIADFEHIEIHDALSADDLQHHLGDHLFSLALVLGSYFRGRSEFDPQALSATLRSCFMIYNYRLTGAPSPLDKHINWEHLALRMSEEMAGDRYMKAILRGGGNCQDREVLSGPHLGMFNGPFPIPELIRAVHITSLFGILEMPYSHS